MHHLIYKTQLERFVALLEAVFSVELRVNDAHGKVVLGPAVAPTQPLAEAPIAVGLVVAGRVAAFARSAGAPHPRIADVVAAVADFAAGLFTFSEESGENVVAIARNEERFRLALEATNDAIWDWDLTTNLTYYSRRWYQMLGYDPGAFPSNFETWAAMTDPADVERTVAIVNAAVERGEGYEAEFRMRHANGTWRHILGRGRVSGRDGNGRPNRMSGVNTDITAEREAQRDRARLEAALRQREKMSAIGQLAGGIAHDFNNQLTTVLGSAELLLTQTQDAATRELIEDILSAAMRSAELTRKLLSFSRQGKVQRGDVDMHALVHEVASVLRRSIDRRIRLETDLQAARSVVEGDAADLQNALLNLALNARDAMPEGGVLTFRSENAHAEADPSESGTDLALEPSLRLSIEDTGHGMTAEVQARLFEPFFTTKAAGMGTGMGLASVYGTVRAHHGSIRVHSQVGRGTSFALYLPVVERKQLAPRRPTDIPEVPACRALVVDDEPLVREQLARSLRSMGHTVEVAASGAAGIEMTMSAAQPFDVALVDVSMPEMGGRQTVAALRKVAPKMRFVVTSGFAVQGEVQAMLDDGADAFLPKPFFRSALAQALKTALAGHKGNGRAPR